MGLELVFPNLVLDMVLDMVLEVGVLTFFLVTAVILVIAGGIFELYLK